MVKINPITMVNTNGADQPLTYKHKLNVKKNAPTFNVGDSAECYITKYDNDRYAVFSSSGVQNTKYHVFESVEELHEHFDEL